MKPGSDFMPSEGRTVVVGTRGSRLATRQSELVTDMLRLRYPRVEFVVRTVQTEGDRNQRDRISAIGDKGVFVRAIEQALRRGTVDIAVHSLKDVPADIEPADLVLAAFSPREDPRDVLVAPGRSGLEELARGARIGTGSLRRRAQLHALRPDLLIEDIRGNVDTRLRHVDAGEFDGVLLAAAGLARLGLEGRISQYFSSEEFVPDAGQGVIAVQTRRDGDVELLVREIDDRESRLAVQAERAVVRALGADCHSPVGVYATVEGERVRVRAMAASEDCSRVARVEAAWTHREVDARAVEMAERLRDELERRSLY
jgi:hydroxymethylbilane synthase